MRLAAGTPPADGTAARFTPYRPRPVRCLGLHRHGRWRMKLYALNVDESGPPRALLDAALAAADRRLDAVPDRPAHHGLGFVMLHPGGDAVWLLVSWWVEENMLAHAVLSTALDGPVRFESAAGTAIAACVWEIAVIKAERDAWVRHVLVRGEAPDLDTYLADRFEGEV